MVKKRLTCRASVVADCRGSFMADEDEQTDSTIIGETVVCTPCYIRIEPFMRMNSSNIPRAANEALGIYNEQLAYCAGHDDPQQLVDEVKGNLANARPGSPYYVSGMALRRMAEDEVKRRVNATN